jgi:hypothetical protein
METLLILYDLRIKENKASEHIKNTHKCLMAWTTSSSTSAICLIPSASAVNFHVWDY